MIGKLLAGALGAAVLGLGAAAGLVQAGAVSFAADEPHADSLVRLITWARERSIARAAADLAVPPDLAAAERIRRGAGNYEAMCVQCHLSPAQAESELRAGMYPLPPDLARDAAGGEAPGADARRFWIVKHGIKGSGMPAWAKGGMDDGAIWDMVALIKVLPGMDAKAYRQLVAASDGHSHAGMEEQAAPPAPAAKAAPRKHSHAGHSHKGHAH